MKIGIYDPYLDSMSGGEKYMLTMAECFSAKNDVAIFWDDESIIDYARKKLHLNLSHTFIKPNIFSSKVSLKNRQLESRKYDCLIVLSDGSIPFTFAKKTILHFQFPVEWVNAGDIKTKLKLLKIDKVICNSLFTKRFIDKKFSITSYVVYPPCISTNYIDNIASQKIESKKKNNILTVGRYTPLAEGGSVKKIEMMIDVFKKMIDKGLMNWRFTLAISFLKENEKYIKDLENYIKNYPITIIKNSNFEDLVNLYTESKIYWHAAGYGEDLEKHPERAEHFGITTVEAMAHKVVPIVIDAGGQPEIVDDKINGFLWRTEEELMQKTKKIMIDDALRRQMGNLALKKAKQFSTENFCKELKDIIR